MIFAFLRQTPVYDKVITNEYIGGLYNGYVAFDDKLPLSIQGSLKLDEDLLYDDSLDNLVNVHGGITFDTTIFPSKLNMLPITAIPDPETWADGIRCIGFDTLHYRDTKKEWDYDGVKDETIKLYKQILNLIKNEK